ncbi:MAG: hypothetical protein ACRCYB_09295 [Aeromonas veronii]
MGKHLVIKACDKLKCPSCGHVHDDPIDDFVTADAYLFHDIQEHECDSCNALIEFSAQYDNKTFDVVVED